MTIEPGKPFDVEDEVGGIGFHGTISLLLSTRAMLFVCQYSTLGELLTAEEIREIVAYMKANRESADPFDMAVNGETLADARKGAEIVEPYIEAGATWWIEYEASRETFEEYRERIRGGPPRS